MTSCLISSTYPFFGVDMPDTMEGVKDDLTELMPEPFCDASSAGAIVMTGGACSVPTPFEPFVLRRFLRPILDVLYQLSIENRREMNDEACIMRTQKGEIRYMLAILDLCKKRRTDLRQHASKAALAVFRKWFLGQVNATSY